MFLVSVLIVQPASGSTVFNQKCKINKEWIVAKQRKSWKHRIPRCEGSGCYPAGQTAWRPFTGRTIRLRSLPSVPKSRPSQIVESLLFANSWNIISYQVPRRGGKKGWTRKSMNYAWARKCDKAVHWKKVRFGERARKKMYVYIPPELLKPLAKDEPKSCKSEQLISNQGRR